MAYFKAKNHLKMEIGWIFSPSCKRSTIKGWKNTSAATQKQKSYAVCRSHVRSDNAIKQNQLKMCVTLLSLKHGRPHHATKSCL